MSETDPELDVICEELVEWMNGWEWFEGDGSLSESRFKRVNKNGNGPVYKMSLLKTSLDLVREIEVAVIANFKLACSYRDKLKKVIYERQDESLGVKLNLILADTKDRLIALRRTLKESGEL